MNVDHEELQEHVNRLCECLFKAGDANAKLEIAKTNLRVTEIICPRTRFADQVSLLDRIIDAAKLLGITIRLNFDIKDEGYHLVLSEIADPQDHP